MDTLARGSVERGGKEVGTVSQMVTEVRTAGDVKRAVRVVLEARRWRVLHVSVVGEAQPSAPVCEPLGGLEVENPAARGGGVT
jgi:hypothetical protein